MAYCKKCGYGIGSQGHYDFCIVKRPGSFTRESGEKIAEEFATDKGV